MTLFKCKMCGGDLEVTPGTTVAECEYCGTKQTLPKVNEEVIRNLFNRANALRLKCEFDKAEQIYEKIVQENNAESEAHWGIVLCKYGIEYVEDPKTYKRIPTCHRTSYDAVTADADYLAAMEHADPVQRGLYEEEAKAIDEIQRGILSIVKVEKPFDVFICYKETDESGKRTVDSAIANEIYYQLTQEGLKVFYAAITLEDKLGREYEPYIFAALNSAKTMLVIGTKPQYFTAVWVKNEWSRFLKLMKTDRSKLLIPCYKDMDAYELPEEFAHLQAQDMGKIGFINDIVRGIKKVTVKEEPRAAVVKETVVASGNVNTAPLLRRVFLFLEDGDWSSADEYCEKVLDIDPECGEAYLGKLMAERKIRRRENLSEQAEPFDTNAHYKKALRFGDDKLRSELADALKIITQRVERARLLAAYQKAELILNSAKVKEDYVAAAEAFEAIAGFEDAGERARECREKYQEVYFGGLYSAAVASMKYAKTEEDLKKAQAAFEKIGEYKDSRQLATECAEKAEYLYKNGIYTAAVALMAGNRVKNYRRAIAEFEKIRDFQDAAIKIDDCSRQIEELNAAALAARNAKQNRAQLNAEAIKEKLPIIKKIAVIVVPVLVVAILLAVFLPGMDSSKPDDGTTVQSTPTTAPTTPTQPTVTQPTEATQPTQTQPQETQPSETQPLATQPQTSQPPATQPTGTQPPVADPSKKGSKNIVSTVKVDFGQSGYQILESNEADQVIFCTFYTVEGQRYQINETIFDKNGDPIGEYRYCYEQGTEKLASKTECYFDANTAAIIHEITVNYDSAGNITYQWEYERDSNGKQIKSIHRSYDTAGNITLQKEDEYDSNGNNIKTTQYDAQGNVTERSEREHDSNGNIIKEIWYDAQGNVTGRSEYKYDSNGNCVSFVNKSYDDAGNLALQLEWEYDSNGKCTKYISQTYGATGKLTEYVESEYNAEGLTLKETRRSYDDAGNHTNWIVIESDSNGYRVKATWYDAQGNVNSWAEYENDSNGNEIRVTYYDAQGNVTRVQERTP